MLSAAFAALWFGGALSAQAQNNAIFSGGSADGFHRASSLSGGANLIHEGGVADGHATGSTFAAGSNPIFLGASGDGHDTGNGRSITTNLLFAGGAGDGHDADSGAIRNSPYDRYMLALGIYGLEAREEHDADQDRFMNVEEFGFGSNAALATSLPVFHTDRQENGLFRLTYQRRKNGIQRSPSIYLADGLSYTGQGATDLLQWSQTVRATDPQPGLSPPGPDYEYGAYTFGSGWNEETAFLRVLLGW